MTHINESGFEPAQFLVENIELLPKGRVLDVAMGSGRNAIYLARLGFEVEGVDISPEAINTALESAEKAGVTIRAQVADLEADYYSVFPRSAASLNSGQPIFGTHGKLRLIS